MSIHLLADQGDKSGVAQCIAARANVNEADTTGQKPLHYAAAKGFGEVVALLLQHDADPNSKSDKGTTPLHEAAKSGKLETVALLLENKGDPTSTDNEHKSPLHYAIAGGHAKVVSRLLEYGADINTAAKDGSTPLHVAASKGSLPLVGLLIEKGAKLDVRDLKGNTALAAIPLADKKVPEVPLPSRKLSNDIKSLFTNANGKSNDDDDDEDGSEKTFSDITFAVEGQAIHAHKNIVSLRCPRLGKLFRNSVGHVGQKDKVEVRDISLSSFNAVMEWIYSEDVASLRVAEPEVSTILSILMAADRFNLKDLKALSESIAMKNVGTANLASVWPDVRKCSVAAPELFAYTSYLVASNWNVLATSKMAQDMKPSDVVELCNALKVGEVKEEIVQEPVVHKPTHRAHNSPKRSRAQPHATTSHAPPPETPTRTQPDRAAHRHAPTPAPPPPAPVVPAGPPPEASLLSLPAELSATQIGNMNFWVDQGCKVDGKNLKNIKGILASMRKHKMAWPFAEPVDPVKLNIPNYREIIKEPMDLGTIQTNLDRDHYQTVNQFAHHMRLVFVNALIFNQPGYDIYKMAESLLKLFNQRFESTPWDRSSANGESSSSSYAENLSPPPSSTTPTSSSHSSHSSHSSSSSSSSTSSSVAKQKRKSGTSPAPQAATQPPSRVSSSSVPPVTGNGHHSSPSPSPPPSPPPPVKPERSREHHAPREKALPQPPPVVEEEDMSYDDKRELGRKMHLLDPNQLSHVIQILGANKSQSDDDIEIDMNDVPIDKLRLLEKYVNSCLEPEQKKPKRRHKEDEEEVVIDDQEDVPSKHEHKHKKKKYREDDD